MVFSEKFYVGYSDINRKMGLSNAAIMKIFENIACMHGCEVGYGMDQTTSRWFLTAYHIKIHNRPKYATYVNVNTWSKEMKGFMGAREFEIYNEDGTLAVTANSNWTHINGETGKVERVPKEMAEVYQSEKERTNFDTIKLPKLKECEEYSIEKEFYVDRNYIDINNHMNNVCYMELANLVLPEEVYNKASCDEFEIMYRKAVAYGDTIKCLYAEIEDSYVVAINSQDLSDLHAIVKFYK
ncbi:MAG: thioesterase [Schaedlerella sp.]|nr:thioesterase [Schaedlerella sp.]